MLARKQKETFMLHIVSSGIAEKTYGFFVTKKEMRLNMRDQSRSASRYVISSSKRRYMVLYNLHMFTRI